MIEITEILDYELDSLQKNGIAVLYRKPEDSDLFPAYHREVYHPVRNFQYWTWDELEYCWNLTREGERCRRNAYSDRYVVGYWQLVSVFCDAITIFRSKEDLLIELQKKTHSINGQELFLVKDPSGKTLKVKHEVSLIEGD